MDVQNNNFNFLITADRICDYVPVLSTFSNLVNLFLKCVIFPMMSKEAIYKNKYTNYVYEKGENVVIAASIPILGNLCLFFTQECGSTKEEVIQCCEKRKWENVLHYVIPTEFLDDEEVVLTALEKGTTTLSSLGHISERLRHSREFMIKAVRKVPRILVTAEESIQKDRDVVLAALQTHPTLGSWELIYEDWIRDREMLLLLSRREDSLDLSKAPPEFFKDPTFFTEILKTNIKNIEYLKYASDDLKSNEEFGSACVQINGNALRFLGKNLQSNREIVLKAVQKKPRISWVCQPGIAKG